MNLLGAGCAPFNWYGFLIGGAMLICIMFAYYFLKKREYNAEIVFTVALICIPCAIFGARIYYIFFSIAGGETDFAHWFMDGGRFTLKYFIGFTRAGDYGGLAGLAVYGGLIAAMLGAIIVRAINKRDKNPRNRMTYIQMLDAFFILIALGQAIGRWGNFANQEAYGNYVADPNMQWFPYAVYIEKMGGYYQATFFYEFVLNIIGCGIMLWLWLGRRKSFDGAIFALYGLWYGGGRLFIEGLRSDSLYVQGGYTVFLCIMLILTGVALIACYGGKQIWRAKKEERSFVVKDLAVYAGFFLFALYCVIFGASILFAGEPLRISQLVSGLLIAWGASAIVGHIVRATAGGKKIFILVGQNRLSSEYCGFEGTIIEICETYNKDGSLKADGENGQRGEEVCFSYAAADDAKDGENEVKEDKEENNGES